MKCPNCGADQPGGSRECSHCQIVFTKWHEAQAKREIAGYVPPAPELEEKPQPTRPARSAPVGIAALLLGLGWFLWSPSSGLPVAPGAYVDGAYSFALVPPEGWIVSKPGTSRGQAFDAVSASRPGSPGKLAPSLTVTVIRAPIPRPSRKTQGHLARLCDSELSRMLDRYRQDSSLLVKIDKFPSLKVYGKGKNTLELKPATYKNVLSGAYRAVVKPAVTATYNVNVIAALVPGLERGYLVTAMTDAGEAPRLQEALEKALDSFRVLERPPRYQRFLQPKEDL